MNEVFFLAANGAKQKVDIALLHRDIKDLKQSVAEMKASLKDGYATKADLESGFRIVDERYGGNKRLIDSLVVSVITGITMVVILFFFK